MSTLGAYAAVCAELGRALDFPGPAGAYRSLTQVTTLEVLTRTMERIATGPNCAGKAFNVTNTDVFRWEAVWERLARTYQVETGTVRPRLLADEMAGKDEVWRRIRRRHRLRPAELDDVANWAFADGTLERHWDEILCHDRARRHGLGGRDDSVERFFRILETYREARILP